jgi:hypothetical protein
MKYTKTLAYFEKPRILFFFIERNEAYFSNQAEQFPEVLLYKTYRQSTPFP